MGQQGQADRDKSGIYIPSLLVHIVAGWLSLKMYETHNTTLLTVMAIFSTHAILIDNGGGLCDFLPQLAVQGGYFDIPTYSEPLFFKLQNHIGVIPGY